MEMVTKTYKGADVRLYVEESTVSNSQLDGTCAVNVMFNSKVDKCEITAYDKTITVSGSKIKNSRIDGNLHADNAIVQDCDLRDVVLKNCAVYRSELQSATIDGIEYQTRASLFSSVEIPYDFISYSIKIEKGMVYLYFKKAESNYWVFHHVEVVDLLRLLKEEQIKADSRRSRPEPWRRK